MKRPPGAKALLAKVRNQLRALGPVAPPKKKPKKKKLELPCRCIGCGKFGVMFCSHCRELNDAIIARIAKIVGTGETKFALKLNHWREDS